MEAVAGRTDAGWQSGCCRQSLTREVFDKTTKNSPPPGCRLPDAGFPGTARPGSAGVPPALPSGRLPAADLQSAFVGGTPASIWTHRSHIPATLWLPEKIRETEGRRLRIEKELIERRA